MSDAPAAAVAPVVAAPVEQAPAEKPKNGAGHPITTPSDEVMIPKPKASAKAPEPEGVIKYVVDGKPRELTLSQAILKLQKDEAADKRFREAAEEKKKAQQIIRDFEEDPEAALAKSGRDPAKFFSDLLAKRAKLELMTPEQQERAKLEEELNGFKAKAAAEEKTKAEKAREAQDQRTMEQQESALVAAAEKYQLDGTPETLDMMATIGMEAIELGYPITTDQIAQETVRKEREFLEQRDRKLMSKMSPAEKVAYLGPATVKEILQESLKNVPSPVKPKAKTIEVAPLPSGKKHLTEIEVRELIRKGKI